MEYKERKDPSIFFCPKDSEVSWRIMKGG